jgi:hypothetical protein
MEPLSIGLFDLLVHLLFSPFLRPFHAGHEKGEWGLLASAKGCLFAGEPRNFAFRFVSLGEPQTRRVAVSGRTKQKPAVPPARRPLSHLAVPARNRCQKRSLGKIVWAAKGLGITSSFGGGYAQVSHVAVPVRRRCQKKTVG